MWIYGSGFPKSHNIGKAVDKIEGNEREVLGDVKRPGFKTAASGYADNKAWSGKASKGNSKYEGWGTALKPAHEPIVMARKPLIGTVADNVLEYGVGGINIDGCRIGYTDDYDKKHQEDIRKGTGTFFGGNGTSKSEQVDMNGRFPANIIFECTCEKVIEGDKGEIKYSSGSRDNVNLTHEWGYNDIQRTNYTDTGNIHTDPNCPCYILDGQSGITYSGPTNQKVKYDGGIFGGGNGKIYEANSGGASRFFYCPKASKSDRDEGCGVLDEKERRVTNMTGLGTLTTIEKRKTDDGFIAPKQKNIHPTVKPTELMKYLIRLVTPKGGVVLDPFMGSGSTGKAAVREGMEFIGIEREEEYYEIAKQRIENETNKRKFW
jgi:site-specific DNA-methyltransferase (adenine-specific)